VESQRYQVYEKVNGDTRRLIAVGVMSLFSYERGGGQWIEHEALTAFLRTQLLTQSEVPATDLGENNEE
jgi:hypothetical protein